MLIFRDRNNKNAKPVSIVVPMAEKPKEEVKPADSMELPPVDVTATIKKAKK